MSKAIERQVGGEHYKLMMVEPIEVMRYVLTPEEYRGYLKGCAIKYAMRAGRKHCSDDRRKCEHYGEFLREARACKK